MITLSARQKRDMTWTMQAALAGILVIGLLTFNAKMVVNAGVSLLVTFLPALLEKRYTVPLSPGIVLWMTGAVFLHSIGMFGPYTRIWWWDHLTHTLSAAVVAGTGYAAARAVDKHSRAIHFPPRFHFILILIFVLAFGVIWEVLENLIGLLGTALTGAPWLSQYGVADTLIDLLFDLVGGVIFAVWGTAHVTGAVDGLTETLRERALNQSP